jgi:mannose-1-phosphate guanylyltransferase
LYAALTISQTDPEAILAVFPADHYITNHGEFERTLHLAFRAAETQARLVTVGVRPVFPATGYGYIRYQEPLVELDGGVVYTVDEFVEKPDLPTARTYLNSQHHVWNTGILVGQVAVILDTFHRYLPRLYRLMAPSSAPLSPPLNPL